MNTAQQALFHSPEQALHVTFHMLQRLSIVVGKMIFWGAHLALLVALLALAWLFEVSAKQLWESLHAITQSAPYVAFALLGGSVAGIAAGYWKLAQWADRKLVGGSLIDYLMQDV